MKLQPLIPWMVIVPYVVVMCVVSAWLLLKVRHQSKALLWRWVRRVLLLLLPALIAIGPSVHGGTSSPGVANLDVFFVVDTTPSMATLDYAGTQERMMGVKQDMLALGSSIQGAHLEVITFDSVASVILPLTTDTTAFATAVQGMSPQISSYSQGSTIDKPIDVILQELSTSTRAHPDRYRLLYYLGDGEQTADGAVESFADAAQYVSGGAVMGYGSAEGAKIPNYTGIDPNGAASSFITTVDKSSNALAWAISKVDTAALQTIAGQLKLVYKDRNQGGLVTDLYQSSQIPLVIDRSQRVVHYLNLYWLVAVPLGVLLFWEWQGLVLRLIELREQRRRLHA